MPLLAVPDVIPGSDGAGVVVAVGSAVPQTWGFQPGVHVVTHMVSRKADEHMPTMEDICAGLGQTLHGTLCRRGVFHYTCLVPMPGNLRFEEAATLTCSGLTAWNALMGVPGREVREGDWVLVQGTGGVSVAALQVSLSFVQTRIHIDPPPHTHTQRKKKRIPSTYFTAKKNEVLTFSFVNNRSP